MGSYTNLDTDSLREAATNLQTNATTIDEAVTTMNTFIVNNVEIMNAANIQTIVTNWNELKVQFDTFVTEMNDTLAPYTTELSNNIDDVLGGVG